MSKQHSTMKPWTESEDAILGTDTLVKVSARLNRPTSQLLKRMKLLGIPPFGTRGTPRSPTRVAEEQAMAERRKEWFRGCLREGIAVAAAVAAGKTITASAQELGISLDRARNQFARFLRQIRHSERFGDAVLPANEWRKIEPLLLNEAVRRMELELEIGTRDVWREPLPTPTAE